MSVSLEQYKFITFLFVIRIYIDSFYLPISSLKESYTKIISSYLRLDEHEDRIELIF